MSPTVLRGSWRVNRTFRNNELYAKLLRLIIDYQYPLGSTASNSVKIKFSEADSAPHASVAGF